MSTTPVAPVAVRAATVDDADAVAGLAGELAVSFVFSRSSFDANFPLLVRDPHACLLVAVDEQDHVGYLLGFRHLTFYASAPVASVEEILVRGTARGQGIGRALMGRFERWASAGGCAQVSLATRRAAAFYRALGYEESAAYLRKRLA